ncbi:MAG: hypothetical protein WC547_01135 [Candidatus Omnitrophota bacterium]
MTEQDASNQLILLQQKRIHKLQTENAQLTSDNEYIKKALYIALHERYNGTPLVISADRLAEAQTEFLSDENLNGDHLVWVKGAQE